MRAPPTRTVSSREPLGIVHALDAITTAINDRDALKLKRAAVLSMIIRQALPALCVRFNVPLPAELLPPKEKK